MNQEIYILDAAVFIKNAGSWFNGKVCVSSYLVYEELVSMQAKIEFERMQLQGMELYVPAERFRKQVKEKFSSLKLSGTDQELLAIALELKEKGKKVILVTDDYSLQNACKQENIAFLSVEREGIKKEIAWKRVCVGCGKETNADVCETCGSKAIWVSY